MNYQYLVNIPSLYLCYAILGTRGRSEGGDLVYISNASPLNLAHFVYQPSRTQREDVLPDTNQRGSACKVIAAQQ